MSALAGGTDARKQATHFVLIENLPSSDGMWSIEAGADTSITLCKQSFELVCEGVKRLL